MSVKARYLAAVGGAALVAIVAVPASAQVSVGAFAGISHFSVDQEVEVDGVELSNKTGLAVGGIVNFALTEMVGLQFEPMFLHKGSTADVTGFGQVDVTASYLELPVLLTYSFGTGSIRPYLMVGPTVGYLLSAKQEAEFIPEAAEDIKDRSEDIEFGVTGGLGVQFPLGATLNGFVQGRYYHGLTDTHAEEENHKSRGYKLVAGFLYPLGY